MNADYEQMYYELRAKLQIHESHTHEYVLNCIGIQNSRKRVSDSIISETRGFLSKLSELEKQTW